MKNKSIFLFHIAFLGIVYQIFAQDSRYDGFYQSITKEYSLNDDGSTDFRLTKDLKLLSYRAFHNLYGETFIIYNTTRQHLKINEAYTIMASGKKITTPSNAFNEVLPSMAADAPAYQGLREMVITHTGLERNAIIHLDYQLHSDPIALNSVMGKEILAEAEPVKLLIIKIRIPSGKKLFYKLLNVDVEPEKHSDGSQDVYTWQFTNVPAISQEDFQEGGFERYPRLLFGTFESREELVPYLTRQDAFRFTINESMKKMVGDISIEKPDRFGLALKIQERVVDEMRYYPIPIKIALYQCRNAIQTWNSNGATSLEKAVLMAALMKTAGIDARVCAVVRTTDLAAKVGVLCDFEDFVVMADFKKEGEWFFSTTTVNAVNLNLILPGRSFIPLEPEKSLSGITVEDPSQQVRVNGTFIMSSDPKITGELSVYLNGSAYARAGIERDAKRIKKSISGLGSQAEIQNPKVSILNNDNGSQTFIVQVEKPMRIDTGFYYYMIPVFTQGIDSWLVKTLPARRETSFDLPSRAEEEYSYVITLPSTIRLFNSPGKISIKNKAGEYFWELRVDEGKLSLRRYIKFFDRVIKPDQYEAFKILMDYWNHPRYRELVFH